MQKIFKQNKNIPLPSPAKEQGMKLISLNPTIKIKRSTSTTVPSLTFGELGISTASGSLVLYAGDNNNSAVPINTASTSTPTANTLAKWDNNLNFAANNYILSITTITTSGGSTSLTVTSDGVQRLTGTASHTVILPSALNAPLGLQFLILNESTGTITVKDNGGITLSTISSGSDSLFILSENATSAGVWHARNYSNSSSGGGSGGGSGITYSTSETLTNDVFIDKKPIYRKVVFFQNASNTTNVIIDPILTSSYCVNVISMSGMIKNKTNIRMINATTGNPNVFGQTATFAMVTALGLRISVGSDVVDSNAGFIIIEYTKS